MPSVVIVNQTFAETYFGAANPLGQRVETGGEANAEIVGVAANSKLDTIGEAPKSVVYYPFAQRPRRLIVIARTAGDPAAMLPAVRRAMTELDVGSGCLRRDAQRRGQYRADHAARRHAVRRRDRGSRTCC